MLNYQPHIGRTHLNSSATYELKEKHTCTNTLSFPPPKPLRRPLQMSSLDLYLGRNSWRGGRRLRGAARTVCPAWRWHPGGTAAGWPAGPAQHSACPCAAWTGWFSHWRKTASWWWDGQRGDRQTDGVGHVCEDRGHALGWDIRII